MTQPAAPAAGLQSLLGAVEALQVMDVGAACLAEVPVYKPLLDLGLAHLSAFEGDERQIEQIRRAYAPHVTVYPDFLFDGTRQTLHLASAPSGMTSLLKPRAKALKFFNGFERFGQVLRTESVQTRRLDDIEALPPLDFVKLDIQGAELTVLQNGPHKLAQCLAIQLEVSYICLYEGQPAFGEVDVWMRGQGFVPHCFVDIKRWSIAPTVRNNDPRQPFNQLLESDIVYIRDPLRLSALGAAQLRKLALIAHHSLHSPDLCVHLLLELVSRGLLQPGAHARYLQALGRP